jgi:hypothetical protein
MLMLNRRVVTAFGLAALVCLVSTASRSARADEPRPNPPYKNWAAFSVGASSTLKSVLVDHSSDDPNTIDTTARPEGAQEQLSTYTMLAKSPEKIVIQQTDTDIEAGSETEHPAVKISYPATVSTGKPSNANVSGVQEGEEEIDVAGKPMKVHWVASTLKIGDETSIDKLWWTDAVPGGTVKQVTTKKQGDKVFFERTTTLVSFKAAAE